jgi:hypothetical protein
MTSGTTRHEIRLARMPGNFISVRPPDRAEGSAAASAVRHGRATRAAFAIFEYKNSHRLVEYSDLKMLF